MNITSLKHVNMQLMGIMLGLENIMRKHILVGVIKSLTSIQVEIIFFMVSELAQILSR